MILERDKIEEKYKWDLESLYENIEAWEKDYERAKELGGEFSKYKGRVGENSETLYKVLKLRDELNRLASNVYVYTNLRLDEDTRVSEYQSLKDKAFGLLVDLDNKTSFLVPELLEIEEETIKKYLEENSDLSLYEHYLNEIERRREHVLSSREESIMAKVSELTATPENIYGMMSNADMKFPVIKDEADRDVEITSGNFIPLLESSDRRVRKDTFKAYYGVYESFKNTFAASLAGEVKANTFNADMRSYENNMTASLDANNIPTTVYDNLISSIHGGLDGMYKYMDIRKRALGVDELHMYDLYTPIVQNIDAEFSYEDGKDMIIKALKPLGEEYIAILKEGFDSRWVDVYENVGKRSGGYSSGSYDSKPYILLNFKDTLDSVFTTAHEMGHSIHSYLSKKNQPYVYYRYGIFVAEVASTVNEVLLINHLLNTVEDEENRKYLLNHFLEGFRTTVFRQTMFAEFEKMINEEVENGGALTAGFLSDKYRELNKLYYGGNVVIDREIDMEWARIPHFYYNFYVYQYATGYSAAVAIAKKILAGEEGIVEKYMEFLSSGSSDYPINILKDLGVDMTTKKPVEEAMKEFNDLVEEMNKLI